MTYPVAYRTFSPIYYWIGTGQVMKRDLFHSRSHRKFCFSSSGIAELTISIEASAQANSPFMMAYTEKYKKRSPLHSSVIKSGSRLT